MIRIQMIVPLFAISCYAMLVKPGSGFIRFAVEPAREIYEAFVIYTFFSLLIDMLGGAKSIVVMATGRPPVHHPGFIRYILPAVDISDPRTFLALKRGILQYVWLKPAICFGTLFLELLGWYDVNDLGPRSVYLWYTIVYNCSVSLSLYCLAMFWKILWDDLKPFNPMGKFLCVKLIIFASYWQGVILAVLNFFGWLPGDPALSTDTPNVGVSIQNALLCVELIPFAIGHWLSFSYRPFTVLHLPTARVQFYYALRDILGFKDLVIDFALTFRGDYYNDFRQFDSVDASIAHPASRSRMGRINQGLRYHTNGKQKHWLPVNRAPLISDASVQSTSEITALPRHNDPLYAASIVSHGTSTRALYPNSPRLSPTASPMLDTQSLSTVRSDISELISESLRNAIPDISYDNEHLDEDEALYSEAFSVISNYNLDQKEVKKLIMYPVVDDLITSHEYGYKVKRLREDRMRQYGAC